MTSTMPRFTGWKTVWEMGAEYTTPRISVPPSAPICRGMEPDRPACQMTKPE